MKIRTDFVTNSSSSSFVTINTKGSELAECFGFSGADSMNAAIKNAIRKWYKFYEFQPPFDLMTDIEGLFALLALNDADIYKEVEDQFEHCVENGEDEPDKEKLVLTLKSKYKEKHSEVEENALNKAGYSADISFDVGFDDDSGGSPFIYTRINNGKKLTITLYNDENCDGEDLNGVEFCLMGEPDDYDPEFIRYDDAVNFILNNGGKITHELTETTKYAICPWLGIPKDSVEKIWDQGVPVLTERGFALRWRELLIEDYWSIDFDNPETEYRDWFTDNGIGDVETHYWKDGKWVRCKK